MCIRDRVVGDAQIRKLLQVARAIGLSALQPTADGVAKVDLQISGSWSAFTPPLALGSAQLQSVHAEMRGLNEPVEIASASLLLAPNKITASKVTASVATSTSVSYTHLDVYKRQVPDLDAGWSLQMKKLVEDGQLLSLIHI